jgi:hypothetical protein
MRLTFHVQQQLEELHVDCFCFGWLLIAFASVGSIVFVLEYVCRLQQPIVPLKFCLARRAPVQSDVVNDRRTGTRSS